MIHTKQTKGKRSQEKPVAQILATGLRWQSADGYTNGRQQGLGLQWPQTTEIMGMQISGMVTTGTEGRQGRWGWLGFGVHWFQPLPPTSDSAHSSDSA
jgi:hypothetical protein